MGDMGREMEWSQPLLANCHTLMGKRYLPIWIISATLMDEDELVSLLGNEC
jgi:hypothetical protein